MVEHKNMIIPPVFFFAYQCLVYADKAIQLPRMAARDAVRECFNGLEYQDVFQMMKGKNPDLRDRIYANVQETIGKFYPLDGVAISLKMQPSHPELAATALRRSMDFCENMAMNREKFSLLAEQIIMRLYPCLCIDDMVAQNRPFASVLRQITNNAFRCGKPRPYFFGEPFGLRSALVQNVMMTKGCRKEHIALIGNKSSTILATVRKPHPLMYCDVQ